MTYQKSQIVLAADYNTFINQLNPVYGDTHKGSTSLSTVDYGYGQPNLAPPVAVSGFITHNEWTNLFTAVNQTGIHQNTNTGNLPSVVYKGDVIVAENPPVTSIKLADIIT